MLHGTPLSIEVWHGAAAGGSGTRLTRGELRAVGGPGRPGSGGGDGTSARGPVSEFGVPGTGSTPSTDSGEAWVLAEGSRLTGCGCGKTSDGVDGSCLSDPLLTPCVSFVSQSARVPGPSVSWPVTRGCRKLRPRFLSRRTGVPVRGHLTGTLLRKVPGPR